MSPAKTRLGFEGIIRKESELLTVFGAFFAIQALLYQDHFYTVDPKISFLLKLTIWISLIGLNGHLLIRLLKYAWNRSGSLLSVAMLSLVLASFFFLILMTTKELWTCINCSFKPLDALLGFWYVLLFPAGVALIYLVRR